jgi:hypothetical protein
MSGHLGSVESAEFSVATRTGSPESAKDICAESNVIRFLHLTGMSVACIGVDRYSRRTLRLALR